MLFQESDDAIGFIGRSLFRGSIDLPVNVPIGRYTTQVFLFRDGKLLSQSQSSLQVHKVGFERVVYMLAFRYPLALWAARRADGGERGAARLCGRSGASEWRRQSGSSMLACRG